MTDKKLLGNTNLETIIASMLDQAMLDPYMLDFTEGYSRGVSDALERIATANFNTFLVIRKQSEFQAIKQCFDSLEHRLARNLFTVKSDLLRF